MTDALSTIGAGLELLSSVVSSGGPKRPRGLNIDREIVKALRDIYFAPDGVKALLESIVEGNSPTIEEIENALPDFNDAEWRVDRALRRIEFERLGYDRRLSLRAAEELQKIAYGKVNLRSDIKRSLNEKLTRGGRVPPEFANKLLVQLNALNAMICAVEEQFNFDARR
ncbi:MULTISPECIES: hypothetical protein [Hyphobacterium]|uniref:Uncharacterized protein n=1 Tax=Hyphobacterium vulgare TaxID=1736751 RepID=A0ABV6ZWI3_9PROT